ncbi:DUF6325 family protein [Propionicimonas sp.]|uniref:DUF6325 family protein n=1 Tax=Propionicimonas sp. TaxID=1955623 RepID=UPI0039E3266A
MELGPVELLAVTVPDGRPDALVLDELEALVAAGSVRIVDAVLATRNTGADLALIELADAEGWDRLVGLIGHLEGLLATDDVDELVSALGPGQMALLLVLENTWLRPLLAAVRHTGGEVLDETAITDLVVQEIADNVPDEEENR